MVVIYNFVSIIAKSTPTNKYVDYSYILSFDSSAIGERSLSDLSSIYRGNILCVLITSLCITISKHHEKF
jgi:hypothetical protein